jgi:hypothetical protein
LFAFNLAIYFYVSVFNDNHDNTLSICICQIFSRFSVAIKGFPEAIPTDEDLKNVLRGSWKSKHYSDVHIKNIAFLPHDLEMPNWRDFIGDYNRTIKDLTKWHCFKFTVNL